MNYDKVKNQTMINERLCYALIKQKTQTDGDIRTTIHVVQLPVKQ